jgi:imidazolonepropionase-like amidohydrolase
MLPLVLSLLLAAAAPAQTAPPPLYVVRNVRLVDRVDAPEVTLILRGGRIEGKVDARAETPPGAHEVDGKGRLALPAFVDAYGRAGCATPEPHADQDDAPPATSDVWIDMREADRKGIQPAFRAADVFELDEKTGKAYREQGFGTLLSAPGGQTLSGESVLVSLRDASRRDVVLEPALFQHAAFEASGPDYPSTLMGYMAQLRQLFLDAQRNEDLARRREAGRPGPRPAFDPDLEAVAPLLRGERRLLCAAETARDIERWIALADEFKLRIGIVGGREAWKVADVLAARSIPVFLTLEWGDEVAEPKADEGSAGAREPAAPKPPPKPGEPPQVGGEPPASSEAGAKPDAAPDQARWRYEEPLEVRRERRRLWEEGRDCASRLADAGVEFCFGTGERTPKELVERVRTLVKEGLPVETALAGLTETPARLLGLEDAVGRIELGYDATFAIWTANPLVEEAHIAWLFIEGQPYEFDVEEKLEQEKPARGVDATGVWVFDFESETAQPATAELEMSPDGRVRGTIEYINPGETRRMVGRFQGRVSGASIELRGKVRIGMFETEVEVDGHIEGDEMTGDMVWKWSEGADATKFTARRQPGGGR